MINKPWSIKRCSCGHAGCKDWFVSVTRSDGRVSEDEAKMISAAPDMAEALQRLIAVYSSSYSPKDRADCWDQARAALAKAGL